MMAIIETAMLAALDPEATLVLNAASLIKSIGTSPLGRLEERVAEASEETRYVVG